MTLGQIEKERVEFEAWADPHHALKRDEDGCYLYPTTSNAWIGWLARAEAAKSEIDYAYTTGFYEGRPVWISVEDRLPELDTPVHALLDGHVGIFVYGEDKNGARLWARCYGTSSCDNYGDWLLDDDCQSITHWQPLPAPPKGE